MLGNVKTIFKLKLKLILSHKSSYIILGAILLFTYLLVNMINDNLEEKSSLPIGIVDLDESNLSKELVENLSTNDALYLYTGSITKMEELLKDNLIYTYFVIEEDYERKIKSGNTSDLCSMYYLENNKAFTVISDIVAGEAMYSICLYKGLNTFMKLPEPELAGDEVRKYSFEEYIAYSEAISKDSMFDFTFDIKMVNLKEQLDLSQEKVTNSIIYRQAILAILGILQSFLILYFIGTIKNQESQLVLSRLHLSGISRGACVIGELMTLVLCGSILNVIFWVMLQGSIFQTTLSNRIGLFILMELFLLGVVAFFLLLHQLIRRNSVYQIVGTLLIITFGGFSFLSIIGTVLPVGMLNVAKICPNYWFLTGFTDIIIYGFEGGKESFYSLIVIFTLLIVLYSYQYQRNMKRNYVA